MKELFIPWNPRRKSWELINIANDIIDDYTADGYSLTLRQLYYQFVSRGIIKNTERSYKNLGNTITRGREAGLISWEAIEDRTRQVQAWLVNLTDDEVVNNLQYHVQHDMWAEQDTYIEVWVEKEALSQVIRKPCMAMNVRYLACKGYLSSSAAYEAGNRFKYARERGKQPVLIHLGDHDPSGIDMTRDNDDRLELFGRSCGAEVKRIALNMDQVKKYKPPENPAKMTDSRAGEYVKKYGSSSWELDALEPRVIDRLIRNTIDKYRDPDVWEENRNLEKFARENLVKLEDNWEAVKEFLEDNF